VTLVQRTAIVVDSQPLWSEALERVLLNAGLHVAGKASTLEEALALLDEFEPHLLIGEVNGDSAPLNGDSAPPDGVAWLREVRQRHPELKAIVVSSHREPRDVGAAFDAGAAAYVFKTAKADDVALAIRQTFDGSVFFATGRSYTTGDQPLPSENDSATHDLTRRELEILRLVAEGHTNRAIARMLWVTEQTVKFHLSNIYRKIRVSNRTEASRWAQLNGLLPTKTPA